MDKYDLNDAKQIELGVEKGLELGGGGGGRSNILRKKIGHWALKLYT